MAALSRYNATTGLLGGTRYGSENVEGALNKAAVGKPRMTAVSQRAALGEISNKAAVKKVLKDGVSNKPSRVPITKAKVAETTNTHRQVTKLKQEAARLPKVEKKVEEPQSPMPMDMSANSMGEEAFSKQLLALNVQDIDKDDHDNPQLVSQYVNDIYEYMRTLERTYPIKLHYLDGMQVNGRMRGILIDWLIQVHLRFHLLQETLYLTVAIIDRFLQVQEVCRQKLQLVGVTAMLIASKYEEMYAPEIADFVYITDNAYSKLDIRKMECHMLKTLDFNLGRPLPLHFLRRNSKAGEVDATKHTLAKYLIELTLVDYESVHFAPSQVAAAALCLSIRLLDNADWSDTLSFYSKYTESELRPILKRLADLLQKAGTGKLTAIKTKYQSSKFMKISLLPELQSKVVAELAQAES